MIHVLLSSQKVTIATLFTNYLYQFFINFSFFSSDLLFMSACAHDFLCKNEIGSRGIGGGVIPKFVT